MYSSRRGRFVCLEGERVERHVQDVDRVDGVDFVDTVEGVDLLSGVGFAQKKRPYSFQQGGRQSTARFSCLGFVGPYSPYQQPSP